jgi:Tfp pilus assembly PilM family ATPase
MVSGMLNALKIKGRRAATALSMDHVVFRHLELPKMPEADLREAVKWELKKDSAIAGGELVTDYLTLGPASSAEPEKLSVIAFAAARSDINPLIDTLRAAAVDLRVIDVVPTALLAAFDMAELRRSLDYYHAQFRSGSVGSLHLCGGTALLKGISEFVTETLGIHSFVMDPFRRVRLRPTTDPDSIAAIAPTVAIAAGLATRMG